MVGTGAVAFDGVVVVGNVVADVAGVHLAATSDPDARHPRDGAFVVDVGGGHPASACGVEEASDDHLGTAGEEHLEEVFGPAYAVVVVVVGVLVEIAVVAHRVEAFGLDAVAFVEVAAVGVPAFGVAVVDLPFEEVVVPSEDVVPFVGVGCLGVGGPFVVVPFVEVALVPFEDVVPFGADPEGVPFGVVPFEADPEGGVPFGVVPEGVVPFGADPEGVVPFGVDPEGVVPFGVVPFGADPEAVVPSEGGAPGVLVPSEGGAPGVVVPFVAVALEVLVPLVVVAEEEGAGVLVRPLADGVPVGADPRAVGVALVLLGVVVAVVVVAFVGHHEVAVVALAVVAPAGFVGTQGQRPKSTQQGCPTSCQRSKVLRIDHYLLDGIRIQNMLS